MWVEEHNLHGELRVSMQRKVMISCAVTGSADTPSRNPAVPLTPVPIAASAIDAAKAGAAIVHIHVRNSQTTKPSMDDALYREVVERIKASGSDVQTARGVRASRGRAQTPAGDFLNSLLVARRMKLDKPRGQHCGPSAKPHFRSHGHALLANHGLRVRDPPHPVCLDR